LFLVLGASSILGKLKMSFRGGVRGIGGATYVVGEKASASRE